MGASSTGFAFCTHCGAQFRLFTIMNRDMEGLCKAWKGRHERACKKRSPAERRKWARPYVDKSSIESSILVDLTHTGFQDQVSKTKTA